MVEQLPSLHAEVDRVLDGPSITSPRPYSVSPIDSAVLTLVTVQ